MADKFKLLPLKEVLALSKEKLDEKLAGTRAKIIKSKADLFMANLETEIVTKGSEIQELVAKKDFDFAKLVDLREEVSMLEIRYEGAEEILEQLFPEGK